MDKVTCQLCLQLFTEDLTSFYDDYVNKLMKTFFVNKDLAAVCNSVICQECIKNLDSVYNFTLSANENNLKMLDATLEYDDELCQTCLSSVQNPHVYLYDHSENVAPFTVIQKMLKYCLINLDLVYCKYPIMCDVCWEILKLSYRFLVRCEQSERFCKEHGIAVVEKRNLKELGEVCVSIPVEQSLHDNIRESINETDSGIATCSSTSADYIFSELKIEIEENAISRGIKPENVDVEADDSSYSVPRPYESSDILFSNIVNIKIEDINDCSVTEQSTDVDSRINISPPAHSSHEFCSTISENKVKKYLYVKLEKLDLKRVRNKIEKRRTATEQNTRQTYKCDLCPYSCKKRATYIRHLATHMTLEECEKSNMLFHCDKCNYKSKHKDGLKMHARRIHQKPTCVNSNNTSDMKGRRYIVIPKSEKFTFKCSYCKFETKAYAHLTIHIAAHKNTQMKHLYKCEVCGYQVKKRSGIKRHVVTHLTLKELSKYNKLHKCDMCDYEAKRKDCLALHVRNVHEKLRKKKSRAKKH